MQEGASAIEVDEGAERVTALVPGASTGLAHLSNDELLTRTRYLVAKSNQVLATLLEHLAEVEGRGLYRLRSCSSLYTYCIYELRFSEDAAARRSSAAKWVRRFPALLPAIAGGELHLTGLLMLGPHLTDDNYAAVLARAKFRTKKEIAKLVRRLSPMPSVPDRVEPIGPQLPRAPRNPTWAEFVESLCPPVRELRPGERPSEWLMPAANEVEVESSTAPARDVEPSTAPAREEADVPALEKPLLYQMQFTTSEEHVKLVERAKVLLARSAPGSGLGDLHLQAMRLLVETLEKRRFGAPRKAAATHPESTPPEPLPEGQKQPHRYILAKVRREVFERDEGRCTHVDERGVRCHETDVDFHHLQAFAKKGQHTPENLTLRCPAHNALAAEQDFGRACIEQHRHGARHYSRRQVEREPDG